jgi:hypothetical protein
MNIRTKYVVEKMRAGYDLVNHGKKWVIEDVSHSHGVPVGCTTMLELESAGIIEVRSYKGFARAVLTESK